MKICLICQQTFEDSQRLCNVDGTLLTVQENEDENIFKRNDAVTASDTTANSFNPYMTENSSESATVQPKQNNNLLSALSGLVPLVLAIIIGGGLWLFWKNPGTARIKTNNTTTSDTKLNNSKQSSGSVSQSKDSIASRKSGEPMSVPPEMMEAELMSLDGKTFKLSDYKGKVVLINLWATWCGYCKKEMPDLVEFSEKYKDQGFEVIGLNVDDEKLPEVEEFVKQYEIPYRIGWTNDEVYTILQPRGIPSSYLITRDGKFHWAINGYAPHERLKTKIEEALNL